MKHRLPCAFIACLLLFMLALPASAAPADFDAITGHVNIAPAKELAILYPTKDIQTTATGYQITGTSNPNQSLTLNGKAVENRGSGGTFAVYVSLEDGGNTFTFQQEGASATLTITKGNTNSPNTALTNPEDLPKPLPEYDIAVPSGKAFTLRCYAPSATQVTAEVAGKRFQLAKDGYYFQGSYTLPAAQGTENLGPVQYTITGPEGSRTSSSQGNLYVVGEGHQLQIRVKSVSTTLFQEASLSSNCLATAKQDALDQVTDYSGDMYRLSTGGWITAKAVQPLTSPVQLKNQVESVSFRTDDQGESFVFQGTSHPVYRASHTGASLTITFYNTSGIGNIDVSQSSLFSAATVTQKEGATTIQFTQSTSGALWGYLVEYQDGQTTLLCRYRPKLSGDSAQPLKGATIAVDAGHGGSDTGALGITYGHGTTEKDVSLATAVALQKKLERLGAEVLMLREGDSYADLNQRMATAQAARVDLLISLHANSVGHSSTAASANGVETYYFEPIAESLARRIESGISGTTGRTSRGAKNAGFVMTLNSYAPSVLVELGFLLNPKDFDSMCSKQGIYDTVTEISDSIVAVLQ